MDSEKIMKTIQKKAVGYKSKETTEEYSKDKKGQMNLIRKKVVTKNIPPDMLALKYIIEGKMDEEDFAAMSDEALEAEKRKLLGEKQ